METFAFEIDKLNKQINENTLLKHVLVRASELISKRFSEIEVKVGRFGQLNEIYGSDIERLRAIDEAGFY
ncbi:MAG: hypothetical protein IPN13_17230 [Bacteroidetes bacterium]|nr:hypothetical protein [Bacteroidota bacterium]